MPRPKLSEFLMNWTRSDAPYSVRIRQAIENNRIKVERGSRCCGNHGEVGC